MDWDCVGCVAAGVGPEKEGRKRWDQDFTVSMALERWRVERVAKSGCWDCTMGRGWIERGVSCVGGKKSSI